VTAVGLDARLTHVPRESIDQRRARLLPGAQWIRAQREQQGWSGRELARRLEISQDRVSAYERAQDEPGPDFVTALAGLLQLSELEVWRHLGKPLPREVVSDEAAIAWARERYPGEIERLTGQPPPPVRPDTERKDGQTGPRRITRQDDDDRSASQG
jgi:transcriptional regulator with XRE-family HTH domain